MTDMLEGVPDARLRAPHLTSSHNISAHFSSKFTMFFPKSSLELVAKIPPWFVTKQFPQRSNIPSKMCRGVESQGVESQYTRFKTID